MNKNESEAQSAAVFVYRLVFGREEPAIWLGHLDMMRTFERSLRRAKISLAWSHGYNPRPQMVFALPISVGMAARADLLDVSCSEPIDPADFLRRINSNLPAGISVSECIAVEQSRDSLMSMVDQAEYLLEAENICMAAEVVLSGNEPMFTEKVRKGKTSSVDIRPLILEWKCHQQDSLYIRVLAGSSSNLRPDLLLKHFVDQGKIAQLSADDAAIIRLKLRLK
jgi:radical SAM-linked protein